MRVARNREPGATLEQVAADFGGHPAPLAKWLRRTDTHDGSGTRSSTTPTESAELRGTRERTRMLERGNEALRRAAACPSQAGLPAK